LPRAAGPFVLSVRRCLLFIETQLVTVKYVKVCSLRCAKVVKVPTPTRPKTQPSHPCHRARPKHDHTRVGAHDDAVRSCASTGGKWHQPPHRVAKQVCAFTHESRGRAARLEVCALDRDIVTHRFPKHKCRNLNEQAHACTPWLCRSAPPIKYHAIVHKTSYSSTVWHWHDIGEG
jgi:hypothetical protein